MKLCLFTKTYLRDLSWLALSIQSTLRMSQDFLEWHIVGESNCVDEIHKIIGEKMRGMPDNHAVFYVYNCKELWPEALQIPSGYIAQQWVKMNAHRAIGDQVAWNFDSDVISLRKFYAAEFYGKTGKPIHWISRYNDIWSDEHSGVFNARRHVQMKIFDVKEVSLETMRCMPMPLHGEVLKQGSQTYWQKVLDLCMKGEQAISEFNIIGQFASTHFPDFFEWRNAQTEGPTFDQGLDAIVHQWWSYGGVTTEIRQQVDELCRAV